MNARSMTILAATAAMVMLAGCGDGGEDSASAGSTIKTSSLSEDQYVEKASAVCAREAKDLLEEISTFMQEGSKGQSEAELVNGVVQKIIVPSVESEIEAVRTLGAPEGDEDEIEELLASREAAIDKVKGLRNIKALEEVEDQFAGSDAMYHDYGIVGCTFRA